MLDKNIPSFVEGGRDAVCKFNSGSIWKSPEAEVSFSFLNFDYQTPHIHSDFCELLFIYSGRVLNCVDDDSFMMAAGDCCLIHKDNIHCFKIVDEDDSDFIAINFLIKYDYYEKLKYIFGNDATYYFDKNPVPKLFHVNEAKKNSIYNMVLRLQTPLNEYLKNNEFNCKKIIIDILYQMISANVYSQPKSGMPAWMQELLKEVQKPENFSKKPSDLLEGISYSYSYIAREFKKHMGCSFVKYFNAIKMNYAKDLLIHTDCTVIDISGRLGFSSLSHFNNTFKNAFGFPPSAFRNAE